MTDIVEQTARVIGAGRLILRDNGKRNNEKIAQALADAGLLAEPARTVPTREEIAEALFQWNTPDDPHFVIYGRSGDDSGGNAYYPIADAILALLADQPTVDEAKAQALEEAADYWENETHQKIVPTWLRERAQQVRGTDV